MQTIKRWVAPACLCFCAVVAKGGGLNRETIRRIDSTVNAGIVHKYFPGAQVAVGNRDGVLFTGYYGYHDYQRQRGVSANDLYDIASCTKIVSTTFAIMVLYDQGRVALGRHVGEYLEEYRGTGAGAVTVSQLLTHTSGFRQLGVWSYILANPAGGNLMSLKRSEEYPLQVDKSSYMCRTVGLCSDYASAIPCDGWRRAGDSLFVNPMIDTLITGEIIRDYNPKLRGTYRYCDTNFYILKLIVERVSGTTLELFSRDLFARLDMERTGYYPLDRYPPEEIVPTENDMFLRRNLLCGYVHDDLAALNGGGGGNAGVFSSAGDLAKFCMMMLGGGKYQGEQIIKGSTVELFTREPAYARNIHRALGFDRRPQSSPFSGGYGHTGYTGCIIWIDPGRDLFMVFLSNRVYPTRLNSGLQASGLRTKLWEIITGRKQ